METCFSFFISTPYSAHDDLPLRIAFRLFGCLFLERYIRFACAKATARDLPLMGSAGNSPAREKRDSRTFLGADRTKRFLPSAFHIVLSRFFCQSLNCARDPCVILQEGAGGEGCISVDLGQAADGGKIVSTSTCCSDIRSDLFLSPCAGRTRKVALAFVSVVEAIELGHERSATFLAQSSAAVVPAILDEKG